MAFRLKCRNRFYKSLGQYDAICEFTEVAIREFISNVGDTQDFNEFLENKAIQHEIKVNSVEQSIYERRISQSYILSVYQSFELFLREFKEEHSRLYDNYWKLPETTDSLLHKIIQRVSSIGKAKTEIGKFRIEIFEYYRTIRNKYTHDYIKDDKIDKAFIEILKYKTEITKYYSKLKAPNSFNDISFDDFILFSRTVKDIADGLCDLVIPESKDVFVDYYKSLKQFNKFNEKPDRKRNAIMNDLIDKFGTIEGLETIINELVPLA